ncbi:hypothetical protein M885DRAFT_585290 [Pelagophyceae sp. CCMP2097]|nr:hypothetical protein M885DRAFT_585290 [Pelagophyceae sp. CCMP2097]
MAKVMWALAALLASGSAFGPRVRANGAAALRRPQPALKTAFAEAEGQLKLADPAAARGARRGRRAAAAAAAAGAALLRALPAAAAGASKGAVAAAPAAGPAALVFRAFIGGALLWAVALSAKSKLNGKRAKSSQLERLTSPARPVKAADPFLDEVVAAPRPTIDVAKATAPVKRPAGGGLLSAFRKKNERAIELEELLTIPAEADLADEAAKLARRFSVAIAGLVVLAAVPPGVLAPAFEARLTAPWLTWRAEDAVGRAAAWQTRPVAASHYDAGVRLTAAASAHSPAPRSAAAWRKWSDAGVVSHYDFGVRETEVSVAQPPAPDATAADELARLQRMLAAGLTKTAAAEAFANVANALLVPLVDRAVDALNAKKDNAAVSALSDVAKFAGVAGRTFSALGLVDAITKPVVYEGRASKSLRESLFAKFAAASVAGGTEAPAVEDVDVLQAIFAISDKQAERLSEQVVAKVVEEMMAEMTAAEAAAGAQPGAAPPGPEDVDAQLSQLEDLVNSGSLSSAERKEIKDMFAQMMGLKTPRDVDEALKAAAQNRGQLDPQSLRALDLIQKLI